MHDPSTLLENQLTALPRPFLRSRLSAAAVAGASAVLLSACGGGVQGGGSAAPVEEEGFPTNAVTLVAPSSAGGSTDLISRAVARCAEESLGQPMVVENRPGANGAVGGKEALASSADGYTTVLLFKSLLSIGPLAIEDPDAIQYDEMTVIEPLTVEDYILVVPAASDVQSVEDLVAKGTVNYGTTGVGTGSHLSQALLFGEAGVTATDVPFEGGAPTITAVLGNQVDVAATQVAEAAPQIESGDLRPIAVFSEERLDFFPDVPTAVEAGYDVTVDQRRFLAAPAGLPQTAEDKLRSSVEAALQSPECTTFFEENYINIWDVAPDEVIPHLEESTEEYRSLLEASNIEFSAS